MTGPVVNLDRRRGVRLCLVIEHTTLGRLAVFGERLQTVMRDLDAAFGGSILWSESWSGPLGAIASLAPFEADPASAPSVFRCIANVGAIALDFEANPESSRSTEVRFGITLTGDAPLELENGLDDSPVEVWEYSDSILDARQIAAGKVLPDSIEGDITQIRFQIVDRLSLVARSDVNRYRIEYQDFPRAPYTSFQEFAPLVFGSVPKLALIPVDEGPGDTLQTDMDETFEIEKQDEVDLGADKIGNYPNATDDTKYGIIVDEEVMQVYGKNATSLLVNRASEQPAHSSGTKVRLFAPEMKWAICERRASALAFAHFRDTQGNWLKPNAPLSLAVEQVGPESDIDIHTAQYIEYISVRTLIFKGDATVSDEQDGFASLVFDSSQELKPWPWNDAGGQVRALQNVVTGSTSGVLFWWQRPLNDSRGIVGKIYRSTAAVLPSSAISKNRSVTVNVRQTEGATQDPASIYQSLFLILNLPITGGTFARIREWITGDATDIDFVIPDSVKSSIDLSRLGETYLEIEQFVDVSFLGSVGWSERLLHTYLGDPVRAIFVYTADAWQDESAVSDPSESNYASLKDRGDSSYALDSEFEVRLGALTSDIGPTSIRSVFLSITMYSSVHASSEFYVKFVSGSLDTGWIALPKSLGSDASNPGSTGDIDITALGNWSVAKWTKEVIANPSSRIVFRIVSRDASDDVAIYRAALRPGQLATGSLFFAYEKAFLADVSGLLDHVDYTGHAAGTMTGVGSGTQLIHNPSDVVRTLMIMQHGLDPSEIDASFDVARNYFGRLAATYSSAASATSTGPGFLADSGASWGGQDWTGYVVKDENDHCYLITGNSSTRLYLRGGMTPKLGKYNIAGIWRFDGAITGEIGTMNLLGEIQQNFCCRIGYDVVGNQPKLRFLFPLLGVQAPAVARIWAPGGEPSDTLPSFKMARGLPQIGRGDEPIRRVEILYGKIFFRSSQGQSDFEHKAIAENDTATRGRDVSIEARFISDHYTAQLLAEAVLALFGTARKQWTIPVIHDVFRVIRWGSVIELEGNNFVNRSEVGPRGQLFQVVGINHTPGDTGSITVVDRPMFGSESYEVPS